MRNANLYRGVRGHTAAAWLLLAACGEALAQGFSPAWTAYAGGQWGWDGGDGVRAVATDSQTNAYFAGYLGSGGMTLQNGDGVSATENSFWYNAAGQDGYVAKADRSGRLLWYTLLGEGEADETRAVAVHTGGTVYAAGVISRTGDTYDEGTDATLTALSGATGLDAWTLRVGAFNKTNGFNAVAVDAAGNLYAAGYTTQAGLTNTVAGSQYGGATDAFVMKVSPAGGVVWTRYLGLAHADTASALALGADGSVYVGGQTRSPGWFSVASSVTPSPSNACGFVVKLTGAGSNVWSACLGGAQADAVRTLAKPADSGALYVGGTTESSGFLPGAPLLNAPAGGAEGFLVRLTDLGPSFQTNWCRFTGGAAADAVTALALHEANTVVAGGTTASGGWLPAAGSSAYGDAGDGFLLLLDASGAPLWSRYLGGANSDALHGLAARGGALLVAGATLSDGWTGGGFWDDWNKDSDFDELPDFGASFGLLGLFSSEAGTPPAVTEEPADLTVPEGSNAVFRVSATGFAPLSYRWFRNGVPVTGLTSNSYTVSSVAPTNHGDTYACLVSNYFGTATSRTATLTVIAKGTLTVTLGPAAAVAQGARWRLGAGGPWLAGGASTNLPPGTYAVSYTNLPGWAAPPARSDVALVSGATTALTGTYTAVLPEAVRTVAGTNVTLQVRAPAGLVAWTLVEALPPGLTPTNITAGGVWNSAARTLTFSGVEATTNTYGYLALCATSGAYTVSGTVTTQPAAQSVPVSGHTQLLKANLVRTISVQGDIATVTITMYQPTTSRNWSVEETVPSPLTPTNITAPGEWYPEESLISWSRRSTAMTLTYQVACVPGTHTFVGIGNVTSLGDEPIFGDSVLVVAAPEPVPEPAILAFAPVAGTNAYALAFTSVVNQAYAIVTNAAPASSNGWALCLPVTGDGPTTQRQVPAAGPRLFYRVRVAE